MQQDPFRYHADWSRTSYSKRAESLQAPLRFTLRIPEARPFAYFLDGQFEMLQASRSVLEIWTELTKHTCFFPTPGLFDSATAPLLADLWDEWERYCDRCDEGDLQFADRENSWPSMEDIDFIEILRNSVYESYQYRALLDSARKLVIRSVEWDLHWIGANARISCVLPWIDKSSANQNLPMQIHSIHENMLNAMGGFKHGGMPECANISAFSAAANELEELILNTMGSIEMFASRSITGPITEPLKLPDQLQTGLLELYRERLNGIPRLELGSRLPGRTALMKGNDRVADQVRRKLMAEHGYSISPAPWKLDVRLLPTNYLDQIHQLPSLLSAEPLEDE
jgi:hypothetical protein